VKLGVVSFDLPTGVSAAQIKLVDGSTGASSLTPYAVSVFGQPIMSPDPFGRGPNRARTWADVNPALPPTPILVIGPPPTSGTRDAFVELAIEAGALKYPANQALMKADEKRRRAIGLALLVGYGLYLTQLLGRVSSGSL
jgi:hypothetical protein